MAETRAEELELIVSDAGAGQDLDSLAVLLTAIHAAPLAM